MSDGAHIQISDPRVSRIVAWVWAVIGTAFITVLGVAANNLYQLNITVARAVDADASRDIRLTDHELRLRSLERDVGTLEGKITRGVPPFDVLKEAGDARK